MASLPESFMENTFTRHHISVFLNENLAPKIADVCGGAAAAALFSARCTTLSQISVSGADLLIDGAAVHDARLFRSAL